MNNIRIEKEAHSGNTVIPAGEYTVSVKSDTRQINLEGAGRDIEIYAVGRPTKGTVRSVDVQFTPGGGGSNWSLLVKTPKMGEYLAAITYGSDKKE